jgi:hypothetical protein
MRDRDGALLNLCEGIARAATGVEVEVDLGTSASSWPRRRLCLLVAGASYRAGSRSGSLAARPSVPARRWI